MNIFALNLLNMWQHGACVSDDIQNFVWRLFNNTYFIAGNYQHIRPELDKLHYYTEFFIDRYSPVSTEFLCQFLII